MFVHVSFVSVLALHIPVDALSKTRYAYPNKQGTVYRF